MLREYVGFPVAVDFLEVRFLVSCSCRERLIGVDLRLAIGMLCANSFYAAATTAARALPSKRENADREDVFR
jgi:hypothetical protein